MRSLLLISAFAAFIGATLCGAGCSRSDPAQPPGENAQRESTARDVVDTMTQKNKLDAARRAQATLESVHAQQQRDLGEVIPEE